MDVSRPKRKRKGFTTNLTISKKSKRYRKKTSDKHTTETTFLSTCILKGLILDTFSLNMSKHPISIAKISKPSANRLRFVCGLGKWLYKMLLLRAQDVIQTSVKKYNHLCTQTTDDDNAESLGNKLICALKKNGILEKFANVLNEHEQVDKFVKSITSIAEGKLKPTNLAWKSFLDTGVIIGKTLPYKGPPRGFPT